MKKIWIILLALLLLSGCYSNKNKTEEKARERVTRFVLLMAQDQIEEAEKLLTRQMIESGNKELFLSSFDDWWLKDTSDVKIDIRSVYIPEDGPKNKALVSMTIHSEKHNQTKMVSMPITYEKGNWYLGS